MTPAKLSEKLSARKQRICAVLASVSPPVVSHGDKDACAGADLNSGGPWDLDAARC